MSKITFSTEEMEKIKQAVNEAESKTSGEIATAFVKASDDYARYELTFALFCGFFYFVILMFFSGSIEHLLQKMFWVYSSQYLLMAYGFSTFLVIGLVYLLSNIHCIDRFIIPKSITKRKVNERAVRYFLESGVCHTKDRTGLLIFISYLERRVELLADKGISEKIPKEKWDAIVKHIIDGIRSNHMTTHLIDSIRECGSLLAQHYPIQHDDVNELKDNIDILER